MIIVKKVTFASVTEENTVTDVIITDLASELCCQPVCGRDLRDFWVFEYWHLLEIYYTLKKTVTLKSNFFGMHFLK